MKIFNNTLNSYRYTIPDNIYDYTDTTTENQCFCDTETGNCPPRGFLNATPCNYGAPAFYSFPHFYMGDTKISNNVDGLKPNPILHKTIINVHPKLGFTMSGYNKVQFNVQVRKSLGFSPLDFFDDNLMLPIAWFEVGINEDELPKEVYDFMYDVLLLIDCLELALKYGFLLTNLVTLASLVIIVTSKFNRKFFVTLERNGSGQRRLIA